VIIQIDTNNLSDTDLFFLRLLIDPSNVDEKPLSERLAADGRAFTQEQAEKPTSTRGRRNKQQIAYDEALARFKGPNTGDGTAYDALQMAAFELRKRDANDERLVQFATIQTGVEKAEQSAPESDGPAEDKATEAGAGLGEEETAGIDDSEGPASEDVGGVTIQDITKLATDLLSTDREALKTILKGFGVPRVSAVPEDQYGKLADALTKALA
jgi:hypothetical protein